MGKTNDVPILHRLGSVLKLSAPFRGRIAFAALVLTCAGLVSLFLPTLTGRFVDFLTLDSPTMSIRDIATLMVIAMVVQGVLSMIGAWIVAWVDERVLLGIRERAFDHILKLPVGTFQDHRKGELVSRIAGDVEIVGLAGPQNLVSIIQRLIFIVGVVYMMGVVSPKLLLLSCLGLPLFMPILFYFGRKSYALSREAQDVEAALCGEISDSVQYATLIRTFNAEDMRRNSFNDMLQKAYGLAMKYNLLDMLYRPATALISFSATMVVVFVGGDLARKGIINTGDLVAFIMYIGMLVGSLSMLVSCVMSLLGSAGAASRLFDLLSLPEAIDSERDLGTVNGEVELIDLSFGYGRDGPKVLNELSLTIKSGETVAITGPSGCGKSTLLTLLCGLHVPSGGTITLDGQDVSEVSLKSARAQVSYLEQEPRLVYGSVRDNLRYGDPEADDARIVEAARQAQAHEFISVLPQGYDTILGDDGVKLSAGQRHRLCLARTLLKDSPIMLLDEPGTALDRRTEELLIEGLREVMADRTCILVAHDPAIIDMADRVIDLGSINRV